jgi:hypothetical protein
MTINFFSLVYSGKKIKVLFILSLMSSIIPTDIPIFCTLVGSIGNFNKLRCSSPLWLPLTLQKLISACLPKLSIDYANRVMKA